MDRAKIIQHIEHLESNARASIESAKELRKLLRADPEPRKHNIIINRKQNLLKYGRANKQ